MKYMDDVDFCMYMFSNGQKLRGTSVLSPDGVRGRFFTYLPKLPPYTSNTTINNSKINKTGKATGNTGGLSCLVSNQLSTACLLQNPLPVDLNNPD